jgi:hypothetical protein
MDIIDAKPTTFTTKTTEGEMQLFEFCLAYALDTLPAAELEEMTGYNKDELEAIWQKLYGAIVNHCDSAALPARYKSNLAVE